MTIGARLVQFAIYSAAMSGAVAIGLLLSFKMPEWVHAINAEQAHRAFNPGSDWRVIGAGDFNGDGKADILWQNNDGRAAIWLMDGSNLIAGTIVNFNPGANWRAIGAGDFNGDGKVDILWQNDDGRAVIWQMDGPNLITGTIVGLPGH
jgi:hypothetical protein